MKELCPFIVLSYIPISPVFPLEYPYSLFRQLDRWRLVLIAGESEVDDAKLPHFLLSLSGVAEFHSHAVVVACENQNTILFLFGKKK